MIKRIYRNYKNLKHLVIGWYHVFINGYPAKKLKVIGVTGTDGKTTTCHLIYQILLDAGYRVALISTVGAYLNNQFEDTGFHVTTPDAKSLQILLKRMVEKRVEYVILETTSHAIDQHRIVGCNFWAAVYTNITHEHLDYHATFENYRKVKAKLIKKVKLVILNKDDESFDFLNQRISKDTKVKTYSTKYPSDYKASGFRNVANKQYFNLRLQDKNILFSTSLFGLYNLYNILAAIALGMEAGVAVVNIQKSIQHFRDVPGRMNLVHKNSPTVYVDFAHTPNALENVLKTLKTKLKENGRLIAVFGCAGERDVEKRPLMGDISTRLADVSVFTAEDPRHEDLNLIIQQIIDGIKNKDAIEIKDGETKFPSTHVYIRIPDRRKAIFYTLRKIARNKDIIVVCGKGHEKSLACGDVEIPWSDHEECEKALKYDNRNYKKPSVRLSLYKSNKSGRSN